MGDFLKPPDAASMSSNTIAALRQVDSVDPSPAVFVPVKPRYPSQIERLERLQ